MGLGKSFTCISIIHAMMKHPALVSSGPCGGKSSRAIRRVLFVVPTNVLSHWQDEIEKWTGRLASNIRLYKMHEKFARKVNLKSWSRLDGILLMSNRIFQILSGECPEVCFADEYVIVRV